MHLMRRRIIRQANCNKKAPLCMRRVQSIGKFLFKAAHNIFIVGADYFICQKLNILTGVCYGVFSCVCF